MKISSFRSLSAVTGIIMVLVVSSTGISFAQQDIPEVNTDTISVSNTTSPASKANSDANANTVNNADTTAPKTTGSDKDSDDEADIKSDGISKDTPSGSSKSDTDPVAADNATQSGNGSAADNTTQSGNDPASNNATQPGNGSATGNSEVVNSENEGSTAAQNDNNTVSNSANTETVVVVNVPSAPTVNVVDFGNEYSFAADDKGNVAITGVLMELDRNSDATESFTIVINGQLYPVTVYSNGSYDGRLPAGFSIRNGVIYIAGVKEDMDINIVDHTAISSIAEEPFFEGSAYEEPSISSVTAVAAYLPASTRTGRTGRTSSVKSAASNPVNNVVDTVTAVEEIKKEPEAPAVNSGSVIPDAAQDDSKVLGVSEDNRLPIPQILAGLAALCLLAAAAFAVKKFIPGPSH